MPTRTNMLDHGNFVHCPEPPVSEAFAAYLQGYDDLLEQWQIIHAEWQKAPFSPKLLACRQRMDQKIEDYLAPFGGRYMLRAVEQDRTFLPLSQFFSQYQPVREPFSILHCETAVPLHTVARFARGDDLRALNAALSEQAPWPWWQRGPMGHPCYLFGECVWELKPAELAASDKGLTILFEEALEKDRLKRDRLRYNLSSSAEMLDNEFVPQALRVETWRRAGGRCTKCGSRQTLDFRYVILPSRGGSHTAENVELLCAPCRAK